MSMEEWKEMLIENINYTSKLEEEVKRMVSTFIWLTEDVKRANNDQEISALLEQRLFVRYRLLDMTGTDPINFMWYNSYLVVRSCVKNSNKVRTLKVQAPHPSNDEDMDQHYERSYMECFR